MALKKEAIEKIAKLTKLKTADIEAAIKDEAEVDLVIEESLTAFTDDEVDTLKENEYNRGKVSSVEIAVKDVKSKLKLEFQGKTIEGLVEAAQKKAIEDAKISPDKKVQELTEKVQTLQATVTDQEQKLADKDAEVSSVKLNTELVKNVPSGATLEPDEIIGIMKLKGYDFQMQEGKLVVTKDGKIMQDKVANPLPVKQVIEEFVTEKKLIVTEADPPGGRGTGGSGKPPVKWTKLSELKQHFLDQKKSLNGAEFMDAVNKATTENKEFALDQ